MPAVKRKALAQPPPAIKRRSSGRHNIGSVVNPDVNAEILDGLNATRASPDVSPTRELVDKKAPMLQNDGSRDESPLSDAPEQVVGPEATGAQAATTARKGRGSNGKTKPVDSGDSANKPVANSKSAQSGKTTKGAVEKKEDEGNIANASPPARTKAKDDTNFDPEAADDEDADPEDVKRALARPPPVNSDYLPLPWKGRLGYACLNTYLRNSNPPVFSSRTCRIQSILEHRHPLQNPDEPEHPTKNRPDRTKPADVELGMRYLQAICLANVGDISKMVRWNDRYGIKFMRLSSEMFPFASHPEYGYELAPFAAEALAEAGRVIAQHGHRVTTHPGQFTQLGSPRRSVIENAVRDLTYHDAMLSLLKLPPQQDRDAVMIIHMGGVFDDKAATIARFKEEYSKLPQSVKNRIVLENDDVSYTVHDLLPVCEELNIPFVLDYHHHNILFDVEQIREGTADIVNLYPRILATWARKNITPKMHYSEPTPSAITPRQRRKHNPRVATLPPCPPTMDLMIEAKDKEQAVFELMRTFKLPGFDTFTDIIPFVREDDNKIALQQLNRKKGKKTTDESPTQDTPDLVPDDEVGMGGPLGRVYWPPGMEDYLRPKKREVKPKKEQKPATKSKAEQKEEAARHYAERQAQVKSEQGQVSDGVQDEDGDPDETPATKKAKAAMKKKDLADKLKAQAKRDASEAAKSAAEAKSPVAVEENKKPKRAGGGRKTKKIKEEPVVPTPSPSLDSLDEDFDNDGGNDGETGLARPAKVSAQAEAEGTRRSARVGRKRVSYVDDEDKAIL